MSCLYTRLLTAGVAPPLTWEQRCQNIRTENDQWRSTAGNRIHVLELPAVSASQTSLRAELQNTVGHKLRTAGQQIRAAERVHDPASREDWQSPGKQVNDWRHLARHFARQKQALGKLVTADRKQKRRSFRPMPLKEQIAFRAQGARPPRKTVLPKKQDLVCKARRMMKGRIVRSAAMTESNGRTMRLTRRQHRSRISAKVERWHIESKARDEPRALQGPQASAFWQPDKASASCHTDKDPLYWNGSLMQPKAKRPRGYGCKNLETRKVKKRSRATARKRERRAMSLEDHRIEEEPWQSVTRAAPRNRRGKKGHKKPELDNPMPVEGLECIDIRREKLHLSVDLAQRIVASPSRTPDTLPKP